jgi:NADH-quinone oxidoreductase subunit E
MPVLSEETREKIRAYFPRYPTKQAVTLPALHLVHDELRCVPVDAIREIADLLDLSPAEVHDTMSFYGIFRDEQHKLGKTRLWVCRGLACALRGGEEVLAEVCQKLNVRPGGTSADGKITVEFAECIGVCEGAPAVMINDSGRGNVTLDGIDTLLEEARRGPVIKDVKPSPPRPRPLLAAPQQEQPPAKLATFLESPVGPPDDLEMIKGIGEQLKTLLNSLGIYHYRQIANWTDEEVALVDSKLEAFRGRISRDQWIEQARLLAAGDIAEFERRFGKLGSER